MNLCIDLNSDKIWQIDAFLVIPHNADSELSLTYYEYKIKTMDDILIEWLCKDKRDILIYIEEDPDKYHELSGCSSLQEDTNLISVKIWFYRTGTKNMTQDKINMIGNRVLSYKRNQIIKNLEL